MTCTTPTESSYTEDDYAISGAYGTIAPLVDQDYYDTRRRTSCSAEEGSDDGECREDSYSNGGEVERGRIDFKTGLYGREEELSRLRGVSDRLSETNGSSENVVFIKGYSGVGKSALIRQFVRTLKESSKNESTTIYASGKYTAKGAPFAAFSDLFSQLVRDLQNADLLESAAKMLRCSTGVGRGSHGAAVLGGLWPQLFPLLDGTESSDSGKGAGQQQSSSTLNSIKEYTLILLKLLCEALETIGSSSRIVFLLDDLQWIE